MRWTWKIGNWLSEDPATEIRTAVAVREERELKRPEEASFCEMTSYKAKVALEAAKGERTVA